jgi:ubiquinone/menaquinone biosynthesis C-methylase UbiE
MMHQRLSNLHQKRIKQGTTLQTRGIVMDWGWTYDLVMWFLTFGRERALRQRIADMIGYQPGEAVLDVGCGTGSLALVAKERVGNAGRVHGIDPAPKQIDRARAKASRQGLDVNFQLGVFEKLVFPDQTFDVVQSTFAIDHAPADLQRQGLREIARVLKPGGRLFILITSRVQDLAQWMKETGFAQVETGEVEYRGLGKARLYFVRGLIEAGA